MFFFNSVILATFSFCDSQETLFGRQCTIHSVSIQFSLCEGVWICFYMTRVPGCCTWLIVATTHQSKTTIRVSDCKACFSANAFSSRGLIELFFDEVVVICFSAKFDCTALQDKLNDDVFLNSVLFCQTQPVQNFAILYTTCSALEPHVEDELEKLLELLRRQVAHMKIFKLLICLLYLVASHVFISRDALLEPRLVLVEHIGDQHREQEEDPEKQVDNEEENDEEVVVVLGQHHIRVISSGHRSKHTHEALLQILEVSQAFKAVPEKVEPCQGKEENPSEYAEQDRY